MLPVSNRLKKKKDFEKVFKQGRSSYDGVTGVKSWRNGREESRFGVVVGVKVSKKAVVRNQVKRRIREVLRRYQTQCRTDLDCIIIALPGIADKSYPEIERSVTNNLKKLNILKR